MTKRKNDKPDKLSFPATVVGGRPKAGLFYDKRITAIEALLAFASESDTARKDFLKDPVGYARTIGLDLSATDRVMLEKTDRKNLERMVATVGQSGSVTRRFILVSGVATIAALVGFCALSFKSGYIVPVTYGLMPDQAHPLKYKIKSIRAETTYRKEDIEKLLQNEKNRIEYIGHHIGWRFIPDGPYKLRIDFIYKKGVAVIDGIKLKTSLIPGQQQIQELQDNLGHILEGMFTGMPFKEGETFSFTVAYKP